MHASEVTAEVAERANALYWDSDRSVNQIAEDLDLSKGALYSTLQPLASGLGCPLCGDEVVWANRTARDRDQLGCPTCDWDGSEDETTGYGDGDPRRPEDGEAVADTDTGRTGAPVRGAGGASDPSGDEAGTALTDLDDETPVPPRPLLSGQARTLASGALIGATVGLALVLWARRR